MTNKTESFTDGSNIESISAVRSDEEIIKLQAAKIEKLEQTKSKADKLLKYILDQHHDVIHQVIYEDLYKYVLENVNDK